jgi:2-succinyl-5-enolpyruvyl-6-hydroxy-3-cyclohexene-1-carboxylate synthase
MASTGSPPPSTALGVAAATGQPTVLLTGDLAFLHDLHGLLLARSTGVPLTVVVVNNDGGGIFETLPYAGKTPHFERFFSTPHGLDLAHAAALAGARFARPEDARGLRAALREASGLTVIEVRTDRREGARLRRELLEVGQ